MKVDIESGRIHQSSYGLMAVLIATMVAILAGCSGSKQAVITVTRTPTAEADAV